MLRQRLDRCSRAAFDAAAPDLGDERVEHLGRRRECREQLVPAAHLAAEPLLALDDDGLDAEPLQS